MNLMASGQQQPPLLSRKALEDQTTQTFCNSCWLKRPRVEHKCRNLCLFFPHESGWIFIWDVFLLRSTRSSLDSLAVSSEPGFSDPLGPSGRRHRRRLWSTSSRRCVSFMSRGSTLRVCVTIHAKSRQETATPPTERRLQSWQRHRDNNWPTNNICFCTLVNVKAD